MQSRQIGRGALLRAREHRNNGRHTDQERNRVFFCIFQTGARRKITQDNDLAAGVQRRAGAAGVNTAAVEPRGHVHRAVDRAEREVHHDIVCGQHLVDVVDRHALGAVGRAGGIQTGRFIVDVGREIDRGIGRRTLANIILIAPASGGENSIFICADNQLNGRPVLTHLERPARKLAEFCVVYKHLRRAVVDDERNFARALTVIHRTGDRADFVCGKVKKDKLGRVEQSKHDYVVFADAVRAERVSKTVDLAVQLAVGPAAVRMRIKYGGTVSETRNIAQKTVQIGKTAFECIAEHGNVIGIAQRGSPHFIKITRKFKYVI